MKRERVCVRLSREKKKKKQIIKYSVCFGCVGVSVELVLVVYQKGKGEKEKEEVLVSMLLS